MLLTVNAGSSSLKVSVFENHNIHSSLASLSVEHLTDTPDSIQPAVNQIHQWLTNELSLDQDHIEAIGHRVVHGGAQYHDATPIDDEVRSYLASIISLAPNHMPIVLTVIDYFLKVYPDTKQVACFDTGFFHDIPEVAKSMAIPLELQKGGGLRRYGFHGLSYQSLMQSFESHEGSVAARGRVIMAHLGNGVSLAACKNGKPVDMTMGFTPLSGVMMSTRCGDIDPGAVLFMMNSLGMNHTDVAELITYKSGLLGVSGVTGDMEQLLQLQHYHHDAKLAIELFCYQVKKTIGAFVALLDGVDSIIFSGGIGERSAEVRARICSDLDYLGIRIDEERNMIASRLISADTSKVGVHVIQSQEDNAIARQTYELMQTGVT
jgi:acetate kinase